DAALERAGRLGDGWLVNTRAPADALPAFQKVHQSLAAAQRPVEGFGIDARIAYGNGDLDEWQRTMGEWAAMGVTHLALKTMGRALAGGPLAVTSMARLFELSSQCVGRQGLSQPVVEQAMRRAWFIPDPAATARPLANLPQLFGALRGRGLKIAIATSDDRAP